MAGLASINIRFTADLAQFSSEIQNSARQLKKVGSDLQTIGAGLSVGLTAPLLAFGVASVNAFDQSAKAIAQVDAALKSTGGTVGFNSEQLQKLAADLQAVTTFDDDQILKEATANLLTFNKVTGDTFVQAQKAALDLATRLDGDLQSATLQVGKALQEPVKGLTALSKAGVSFSSEQKAAIKSMVATNNIAGAQSIILKELENQFGGSAEAAAKAGTGSFKQLSNQIGDLSEEFGKIIVDALKPFIENLKGVVSYFQSLSPEAKKVIAVIGGIAVVLGPTILAFGTIVTLVPTFVAGMASISAAFSSFTAVIAANPIGAVAVALGLIVGAFFAFNNETKKAVENQNELNKFNQDALTLIARQKVGLDGLIATAKNETLSKKERLDAIKQINKISPEYLGNLNLENIGTDKARKAIELYNVALLAGAKARIAQQKIQDITNKQAQQEVDAIVNAANIKKISSELEAKGIKNNLAILDKIKAREKEKENASKKQYQQIYEQNKQYIDLIKEVTVSEEKLSSVQSNKFKNGSVAFYENQISALQNLQKNVADTSAQWERYQDQIDGVQKKIDAIQNKKVTLPKPELPALDEEIIVPAFSLADFKSQLASYEADREKFSKTSEDYKRLTEQINNTQLRIDEIQGVDKVTTQFDEIKSNAEAMRASLHATLVDGLGGAFSAMSESMVESLGLAQSGLQGFVAGLAKTVLKMLSIYLAQSISASIAASSQTAAASGPVGFFALPGMIATAVGGVIAAFASIPKFETGGVVSGSSFYGDKILARVNSGELILNDRQQRSLYGQLNTEGNAMNIMLGAGWELSGDMLRLVLDRNDKKQNRLG